MPYGNNRAAPKPRASFQTAGGTIIKYRHPMLAYQVDGVTPVDEIDISRCLKLNDTFLDANPTMDNAVQEVLVDGSVITITNHVLAGEMTIQVMPTTGLVGTGDFIAAAHLIIASKDSEGGTLTVIEFTQGKKIVTIYYGVGFKRVPHKKKAGNTVVPYPMVLCYAGWIQGVSDNNISAKSIWAVGNRYGISAVYKPYDLNDKPLEGKPITDSVNGVSHDDGDSKDGDYDMEIAKERDPISPNVSNVSDNSSWD